MADQSESVTTPKWAKKRTKVSHNRQFKYQNALKNEDRWSSASGRTTLSIFWVCWAHLGESPDSVSASQFGGLQLDANFEFPNFRKVSVQCFQKYPGMQYILSRSTKHFHRRQAKCRLQNPLRYGSRQRRNRIPPSPNRTHILSFGDMEHAKVHFKNSENHWYCLRSYFCTTKVSTTQLPILDLYSIANNHL